MRSSVVKNMLICTVVVLAGAGLLKAAPTPGVTPPLAALAVATLQTPSPQQPPSSVTPTSPRAVLNKYCVTCHNARLKTGGLVLDALDVDRVGPDAEVWEKVVKKLHARAMPLPRMPRPDKATYEALIASLEAALDAAAAAAPDPGRPAVHRLNRVEYTNAIRDLLDLEIDGRSLLPADDAGYGFDNIADVLAVSPGLLERYLLAATKISRLAIADPATRPIVHTYRLPYLSLVQEDRLSEDLPFGSRGGIAIRHHFPVDGEYILKIRLQRNSLNIGYEIRGLDVENQIDVRLDGARAGTFTTGGGNTKETDRKEGKEGGGYKDTEDTEDARLKVRLAVKAGPRVVGVTFPKRTWYVEGVGPSRLPVTSDSYASGRKTERTYGKIEMGIDSVDIVGPFEGRAPEEDTPSRRRIFVCHPTRIEEEEPCAKRILSTLARRAYRRPVTAQEVRTLVGFYTDGRKQGDFDAGLERALERLLVSPNFLFRIEPNPANIPPGSPYRVTDLELASRLSFFLWSSMPDDRLLDLAAAGKLKDPAVLDQEVRRMLNDPKSKALVSNFFGQWLYLRNVSSHRPDPQAFPEFDDNLREAFQRETELFLETQLREDRSAIGLLTANYTFVNERLARHYGIPNVYGTHFRRVTFSDDRRAGLLGQGSILTVTSYANRTSPVVRGKWLLENLLGTSPPPPPANVPPFKENEDGKQPTTVRARMEEHRKNPFCASCHSQLDPLGFALENFDGIGKWRDTEAKSRVDASGTLVDGTKFDGPASFRQALLEQRRAFLGTVTEKLLTYALGRGIEYYDMPAVRSILRDAARGNYRWSALIRGIVKSLPFQMRRTES